MQVIPGTAIAYIAGAIFLSYLTVLSTRLRSQASLLKDECQAAKAQKAAERSGRIKAEKELRELKRKQGSAQLATTDLHDSDARSEPPSSHVSEDNLATVYPLRPIGLLRSCFSQRNGTPRQPLLVPLARAKLKLSPDIPAACLEGLQNYSHCWILYVFHKNTDLGALWDPSRCGVKAKVRVPRLNGGRMGVLATRTPHRPVPIGLSVATIQGIEGDTLVLGGADLVDGTPVLDIKPYLPFVDSVPDAHAPSWVQAEAEDHEPLHIAAVQLSAQVSSQMCKCWTAMQKTEKLRKGHEALHAEYAAFEELVVQVLSRDIRSVHQRLHVDSCITDGHNSKALAKGAASAHTDIQALAYDDSATMATNAAGRYHLVLEYVDVSYDVTADGAVVVRGASLWQDSEQQNEITSFALG